MSTQTLSRDRKQILDELENYYREKLVAVQVKRAGHDRRHQHREILPGEGVRIRINSNQREIILSWENNAKSL